MRSGSRFAVPEDTSPYFFSTRCPTRVYTFDPGVMALGKMMEEAIQQIEKRPVCYLVWSNRTCPEYQCLRFAFEFDQTLGRCTLSHHHHVQPPLTAPVPFAEWNAYIGERNQEAKRQ